MHNKFRNKYAKVIPIHDPNSWSSSLRENEYKSALLLAENHVYKRCDVTPKRPMREDIFNSLFINYYKMK